MRCGLAIAVAIASLSGSALAQNSPASSQPPSCVSSPIAPPAPATREASPVQTYVLSKKAKRSCVGSSCWPRPKTTAESDKGGADAHKRKLPRGAPVVAGENPPHVLPEDGSMRARTFYMYFTPNSSPYGPNGPYIAQMERIGHVEGVDLVVSVAPQDESAFLRDVPEASRRRVRKLAGKGDNLWMEDGLELLCDGTYCYPSRSGDNKIMTPAMSKDRLNRLPKNERGTYMQEQGAVADRSLQDSVSFQAREDGRPEREGATYFEGGNILSGTRRDGSPYIVFGRDGLAAARAQLSADLGRAVTEQETLAKIGTDLGVRSANVIPVEQAGEFHIDMVMTPIRDEQILLNDARAAARLQIQRDRDVLKAAIAKDPAAREKLERRAAREESERLDHAEELGRVEDRAARELEAAGLTVHRVPAVYKTWAGAPLMNFLNAEKGIGADGRMFYVALGGERWAQDRFAADLKRIGAADRAHFLDPALTQETLDRCGGISCRVKMDGQISGR